MQLETGRPDDLDKVAEALERVDWAGFSEAQRRLTLGKVEAVMQKIVQKQKEAALRMQDKEHLKKYIS